MAIQYAPNPYPSPPPSRAYIPTPNMFHADRCSRLTR